MNSTSAICERLPGLEARDPWVCEQRGLLGECAATGADLTARLRDIGRTREDLCYEDNSQSAPTRARSPTLDDFRQKPNGVPVVSLFSGCGGADLGLEAAGFEHVALVENNALFCSTLRHNRPDWRVVGPPTEAGDVSSREELLAALTGKCGIGRPFDGLLAGGPPCQPFSIAANQRFSKNGDNFKRIGFEHRKNGNLLFDMLWLLSELRPAAFLIENVEGLYDVDDGEQLQRALCDLSEWGYTVAEPLVLDAAHFRVPQHRRRLFICGSRLGRRLIQPEPSFALTPCDAALRRSLQGVRNHEPREHKPESLLRYMVLGYGERDHLGRVDRLNPRLPSKTVIAGGTNGGGRSHLHPHIPRTLTVRESARLQTFPDAYEFLGPTARQFTQVGNAVPPVLAAQIGCAVYHAFFAHNG